MTERVKKITRRAMRRVSPADLVGRLHGTFAFDMQRLFEAEQHDGEVDPLLTALKAIEKFGHGVGHGRGYTCADMAAAAIKAATKGSSEP